MACISGFDIFVLLGLLRNQDRLVVLWNTYFSFQIDSSLIHRVLCSFMVACLYLNASTRLPCVGGVTVSYACNTALAQKKD